ncbi:hypothetical protein O181_053693 [Austropuccinia psidii MF-1]|uniref:Uncharacterized protein n=1 Tax=Austropuccinia psidii MF-1 TaxID=1389203 RepID=A0A9Q3E4U5_9BASI|nr:hypothetical protein [Austropuccinia psidii MF-1]
MINMKILRKCGGELEHAIKGRCVEPCSTEDYINALEEIITRTRISKTWTQTPMDSKIVPRISRGNRKSERPVLKCHEYGSTPHLANTCTKKTKINEVQVIEEVQCTEEKEESHQYFSVSEDTPVEDYPIENITAFFEVTEVHTHLPQYNRYFTIGENKRPKFSFSNIPKQIPLVSSKKDTYKEEFVTNQIVEAQIDPLLSPKLRHELIDVLYTDNNAFATDDEPLGDIKGHEVDITLNIDRKYPPVLRRPAYPASPRAREALEKHI